MLINGPSKLYNKDSTLVEEANYKNGFLDGKYSSYHDNGEVHLTGIYQEDKKVGKWSQFSRNGNLEMTYYLNNEGVIDGRVTEYNFQGNVEKTYHRYGDTVRGMMKLYENDFLKASIDYSMDGKKKREYQFNKSGDTVLIVSYKNGEAEILRKPR